MLELGRVVAAERVVKAHEGGDDGRERVEGLRLAKDARGLLPPSSQVEEQTQPLVRSRGRRSEFDGAPQLALRSFPVPLLEEAEEAGRNVRLRDLSSRERAWRENPAASAHACRGSSEPAKPATRKASARPACGRA